MLYWLFLSFQEQFPLFNVFRYITFRSGMAAVTALLVVLVLGKPFIRWVQRKQYGQAVRDDGPQTHLKKNGTPTMGGVLIIAGLTAGVLLWADLSNAYIWLLLAITWAYGAIGLLDDAKKILYKNPKGLASRWKFCLQVLVALFVAWGLYAVQRDLPLSGHVFFPFFKDVSLDLGAWYVAFAMLVMVGASNAVNLTDGLDGLAIGPSIVNVGAFFLLCYLGGNAVFAGYLQIPHVPQVGELALFCAALAAAGVGFLWFNTYPAQIFMGDVGALALGGAIGALAVASKHEILLVILGGIFVMETLSVIVQVVSFKLTGRRVFRMAPLHHHFELLGWPEPKVIVRFWIVSFLLALVALSTLKLR
jgi:phospho-N-acetylmuramoyl-pentapeptide-transferase